MELFEKRLLLDKKRQPGWQSVLRELQQWLSSTPPHHPYPPTSNAGCPVHGLAEVCKGRPVKLDGCDCLYHIANIGSVIRSSNSADPFRTNSPEKNWSLLKKDSGEDKKWLRLSKYITGPLPGRRDFTWWTPLDLSARPALPNAHRIGVVNDWLSSWLVLLRWSTSGGDLGAFGRVPTVIDGFDSPIFYATDEQGAEIGTAIDLRRPETLCPGAPELVASYVSSEEIELLPIQVGSEERKLFPIDEEAVMGPLIAYYAVLGSCLHD